MSEGLANLEQRIAQFESLLDEMREARRQAHADLKELRQTRREIERLLGGEDIRRMVTERTDEVVKKELDKIGPSVRAESDKIYAKVGREIDKLIDLSLGKPFSDREGHEDLRPKLAEKMREWLKEELKEYKKAETNRDSLGREIIDGHT